MTHRGHPLRLYLDTNIFLDHFLGRSGRSSNLIREIAQGTFSGVTSYFTLSEIAGVLKHLMVSRTDIDRIIDQTKLFPNIQIIFHNVDILLEMPDRILDTCMQCRDAIHFMVANFLAVDRIVTRDNRFKHAVNSLIPCVTPEQLFP